MECWTLLYFLCFTFAGTRAWADSSKKVKLTDIQTLTLYSGKWTTGKRSAPVPQVHCTGGNAGCTSFVPQVVQCYNRGSDGIDVQWECKTDMDNAYRFGQVDVICEGYDYPDDPYVLKGSCGLEYTLLLTKEGMQKQGGQQYGSNNEYSQGAYQNLRKSEKTGFADVLFFGTVALFIYAIYRSCLRRQQHSPTGDDNDHPDDSRRAGFGYPSGGPPPPGFRPGFTPGADESCSAGAGTAAGGSTAGAGGPGLGGFWTGAATGGLLGYLFSNRNTGHNRGYYGEQDSLFAPSRRSSGFSGGGGGFSSGTRSASGFGGTRRR